MYNDKPVGEIYAEPKEPWNSIQMRAFQKLEMDSISASSRLFGVKLQRDKLKLEEKVAV
jgi:hypothetical protein